MLAGSHGGDVLQCSLPQVPAYRYAGLKLMLVLRLAGTPLLHCVIWPSALCLAAQHLTCQTQSGCLHADCQSHCLAAAKCLHHLQVPRLQLVFPDRQCNRQHSLDDVEFGGLNLAQKQIVLSATLLDLHRKPNGGSSRGLLQISGCLATKKRTCVQ